MKILLPVLIAAYLATSLTSIMISITSGQAKITFKTNNYPTVVRHFFNVIGFIVFVLIFPIVTLINGVNHK